MPRPGFSPVAISTRHQRTLKILALESPDKTMQDFMAEALEDLFKKYHKRVVDDASASATKAPKTAKKKKARTA